MSNINAELHEIALDVASAAAAELLRRPPQANTIDAKRSATDLVTDADRASEAILIERIRRVRPDDGILAEEGGETHGSSGVRWVLDPLDGTTNYVYGHLHYSVSVAVEVGGATAVGVVVDPTVSETFAAVRGSGSWRNGEPIAVTATGDLASALVSTGFSVVADERAAQAAVLQRVLPRVGNLRRLGSAALDLCWVACGRLDAFYERGLSAWDYSAGALIAAEAGATVTGIDGPVPDSARGVLAATGGVHEPLRSLLLA